MKNADSARKIAVIPVYDDSGSIKKVLEKFPNNVVDEVCLVVDCATREESDEIVDASRKIETPVHIILNDVRNGIGFAIRQGLDFALANRYDLAVIIAGNNKDDPREIPRLLKPILKEEYDYVQGSRFLPGGKRVKNPFLRSVFSRIYPFIWTLCTNIRCTDVTNGFRAYRLNVFHDKRISIWQDWLKSYELEYYIHYKVLTLGYRMKEVPVSKIYPFKHRGGYSKIVPFRDWWKIVGPLVYLKLGVRS
jgi:dolichol-phosphate mannosyltransferase